MLIFSESKYIYIGTYVYNMYTVICRYPNVLYHFMVYTVCFNYNLDVIIYVQTTLLCITYILLNNISIHNFDKLYLFERFKTY